MTRPAVIRVLLALFGLFCCLRATAQEEPSRILVYDPFVSSSEDTAAEPLQPRKTGFMKRVFDYFDRSAVDKTFEKKMDFTFVAGPSYSSKTSLSLGVLAAGLYRVDRTDSLSSPSDISLFGNVSIRGYYYVGISGNTFFEGNRHRLSYELGFRSQPSLFWGVGYNAATHNPSGSYTAKKYVIDIQYKYALVKSFYVGGTLNFNYTHAQNLTVPQYIDGQRLNYMATGAGTFVEYDSRDSVTQPFEGWYANLNAIIYPREAGTCPQTFWRVKLTVDYYRPLWRDAVLAVDLYGEFNSSKTPWTMNAMLGSNSRMRGYYEGRFNDLDMITAQVELRQRIYRRIGCAVWGGAGNVFSDFGQFDWSKTLPNYGFGLRWELKKRMNVRFDYGFGKRVQGKLINGLIMSINEAF